MSIFMKANLKVEITKLNEFLEALNNLMVPAMESQGWKLHGCFVERFGSHNPAVVVDIWEMEDMAHVERVLYGGALLDDSRVQRALPILRGTILEEVLTFMDKRGGSLQSLYG